METIKFNAVKAKNITTGEETPIPAIEGAGANVYFEKIPSDGDMVLLRLHVNDQYLDFRSMDGDIYGSNGRIELAYVNGDDENTYVLAGDIAGREGTEINWLFNMLLGRNSDISDQPGQFRFIDGENVNSTGDFVEDTAASRTPFIGIGKCTSISLNFSDSATIKSYAFYDQDFKFKSKSTWVPDTDISVPSGAKYIVIITDNDLGAQFDVYMVGDEMDTIYPVLYSCEDIIRLAKSASGGDVTKAYVDEQIANVNGALLKYNAVQLLTKRDGETKKSQGITYEWNGDVCHAYGTATATSIYNFIYSPTEIPNSFAKNKKYTVKVDTTDTNLHFGFLYYIGGASTSKYFDTNTDIVIPDNAEGVAFRLHVASGKTIDAYISASIMSAPSNEELSYLTTPSNVEVQHSGWESGNFSSTTGDVVGSPYAIRTPNYYPIDNNYHMAFNGVVQGDGETMDRVHFSWFYDENKTFLMRSQLDTIPSRAKYVRFTYGFASTSGIRVENYGMDKLISEWDEIIRTPFEDNIINSLVPKFNKPLLTIIDDDGNRHFLTDIVPLINELNVPISSAVIPTKIGTDAWHMNDEQVREAYYNGAEILNHTYNHHAGSEVESLSSALIQHEYQMGKNILVNKGYSSGDICVFSSSTGNYEKCQRAAERVFRAGIKIGGSVANHQGDNEFALARYRIDYASTEGGTDWDIDAMKQWVDDCVANGGWMIWMFHTSNSDGGDYCYTRRIQLDSSGNPMYDSDGKPIPMVSDSGAPVYDKWQDGNSYPHMGNILYVPMLREAINYARSKGVEICTAEYGLNKYFGN